MALPLTGPAVLMGCFLRFGIPKAESRCQADHGGTFSKRHWCGWWRQVLLENQRSFYAGCQRGGGGTLSPRGLSAALCTASCTPEAVRCASDPNVLELFCSMLGRGPALEGSPAVSYPIQIARDTL